MSNSISLRREAEADILEAFVWYEEQSMGLGSDFMRAVDAMLANIARNPLEHQVLYKNVRRATLRRFPYGLFYIINRDVVIVLGCIHAKRDPKKWPLQNTD
jgi:hypothetical protein